MSPSHSGDVLSHLRLAWGCTLAVTSSLQDSLCLLFKVLCKLTLWSKPSLYLPSLLSLYPTRLGPLHFFLTSLTTPLHTALPLHTAYASPRCEPHERSSVSFPCNPVEAQMILQLLLTEKINEQMWEFVWSAGENHRWGLMLRNKQGEAKLIYRV